MDEQREAATDLRAPAETSRSRANPADEQAEILALVAPLRRFALSRLRDAHDADDVVQETLTRVLAARGRLEQDTLTAYAFTVARNLIAGHYREVELHRRHAPRLVERGEPDQPDHVVLAAEDRRALGSALAELPEQQREQLVEHVVHDVAVTDLGEGQGGDRDRAGAVAAQLARTRARLRLDYVLALRGVTLPTPRCRPVLLALSAGDRRPQATLRAGDHLASCRACAELSEPLLRRRRALAGFVPWIPLGAWHGRTVRSVRGHPAQSMAAAVTGVAVVAVVVAVIVSAVVSASPGPPRPASAPSAASPPTTASSPLTGPDGPVLPDAGKLADLAGRTVRARGVRVLAVPADEGFWVGEGPGRRVWVQLRTHAESPVSVRAGQRLTFTAVVVRNDTGFVRRARVPGADARELARQGAHLEVAPRDVSGAGGSPGG